MAPSPVLAFSQPQQADSRPASLFAPVGANQVILTVWGYLFLSLSALAICLFCWLSYSCVTGAAHRGKLLGHELPRRAGDIADAINSPGRGPALIPPP